MANLLNNVEFVAVENAATAGQTIGMGYSGLYARLLMCSADVSGALHLGCRVAARKVAQRSFVQL